MDIAREHGSFRVRGRCLRLRPSRRRTASGTWTASWPGSRSWPGARLAGGALPLADGQGGQPRGVVVQGRPVQLGLEPLDLQVRSSTRTALFGFADFGWGDVIGEFDGKGKYGVGRVTDPREAGQIVYAEKLREDRIRRSGLRSRTLGLGRALPPIGHQASDRSRLVRPRGRRHERAI